LIPSIDFPNINVNCFLIGEGPRAKLK
jgi:hypothetical protein